MLTERLPSVVGGVCLLGRVAGKTVITITTTVLLCVSRVLCEAHRVSLPHVEADIATHVLQAAATSSIEKIGCNHYGHHVGDQLAGASNVCDLLTLRRHARLQARIRQIQPTVFLV